MRRKNRQKRTDLPAGILLTMLAMLLFSIPVSAADGALREEQSDNSQTEEDLLQEQEESQEALLKGLELGEMQETVNELLGEETFSVRQALEKILAGEEVFTPDFVLETVRGFLYEHLLADREVLFQVVLLVILAALFANFTNVFSGSQAGEASFYIVYMLLLALLIHSFGELSAELSGSLEDLTAFMQALMPSYFLAVTAASGTATAMVF